MREPDIEGVATHDDPESCVVVREGAVEALTGVHVGGAIEPRNPWNRDADAVVKAEGNTGGCAIRKQLPGPARSVNPGMRGNSTRENGEIPWSPVTAGRRGNAKAA